MSATSQTGATSDGSGDVKEFFESFAQAAVRWPTAPAPIKG